MNVNIGNERFPKILNDIWFYYDKAIIVNDNKKIKDNVSNSFETNLSTDWKNTVHLLKELTHMDKNNTIIPLTESNSNIETYNKYKVIDEKNLDNQITRLLNNHDILTSENSSAYIAIKELIKDSKNETMNSIVRVYDKNVDRVTLVSSILVLLSQLNYDDVKPLGQLIAVACLTNKSKQIRRNAVRVFECWDNEDSIKQLSQIKMQEAWLQNYIERVISQIRERMR